jgi:hypothetical protein
MIHAQFIEWRALAFSVPVKPENRGLGPVQVLIADWHRGNGIVTLVLVDDGSASLYFSNGSSILGSGELPKVLNVASELMRLANQYQPEAQQVNTNILPDSGQLQFYFQKADSLYWLPAGTDPSKASNAIIELFKAMNNVISCIREANKGG